MKKWVVFALTLALVVTTAVPAFAGRHVQNEPARVSEDTGYSLYALSGRITAIDPVARTVTVWIKNGNTLLKEYEGTEIVLYTTEETAYEVSHSPTTISFEQLRVGFEISSIGHLVDGFWVADRITAT